MTERIVNFLLSYNEKVSNISFNKWNIFYSKFENGKVITCRAPIRTFQKWCRNNKISQLLNEQ